VRELVLEIGLRAPRGFPPSPLHSHGWCLLLRGVEGTLVHAFVIQFGGTRWWLQLWYSCYSWWLSSPRLLVIDWLVRGFGDCVRPQSRWHCEGLLWFLGGVLNTNSSGLLVSLSYRTCVWGLAVPCGALAWGPSTEEPLRCWSTQWGRSLPASKWTSGENRCVHLVSRWFASLYIYCLIDIHLVGFNCLVIGIILYSSSSV
jgi:hypothetical protein